MKTEQLKQAIDFIDVDKLVEAKDILITLYQQEQEKQKVALYIEDLI